MENTKKSIFETPLLSTKIKSAKPKLFPEGALGYLVGPTLALLANSILSGYFNTYMTNVLNITTWAKDFFTWLPVISVIFVVLGNILVGRVMDHMKTRAGKARPLLLISLPIGIIALLVLFVFPPLATDTINVEGQMAMLVLIAIGYNLWFAIAYPFFYTPHSALVGLSTRSSKDRSLLATISNATGLAAMGLSSMILPFFLGFLFKYQLDPVKAALQGGVPVYAEGSLTEILYYTRGIGGTIIYDQQASYDAWKIFAIALLVITIVGAIIEYFFTRERVTEESFANASLETKKKSVPIGQQLKACFSDKFWIIMIVFFFLYQLGGMLKNVSQLYFCQAMFPNAQGDYDIATGGQFQGTLSIIGAVPTAVGMVVAWPLSNKIGKGKAIMFGAVISVIGGVIGLIAPDNFPLVVTSFVIKALGGTPAMYLSLALLADIMDHQEAKNGFRTDGLTMTVYGAIMAGMTGIATGILNGILAGTNYSDAQVSSELLRTVMPWIFIGGETICFGIIAIIFVFMGVEKFSKFDQKAIIMDQKAAAEAEGVEYIDPATRMAMEEEEADRASDEARKEELRKACEKKGLNFEEEEAKYQAAEAAKKEAADKKRAEAEAKKAAAEKAKADQLAAMSAEERAKLEAAAAEKARKQAEFDAKVLAEFNEMRRANGRPEVEA